MDITIRTKIDHYLQEHLQSTVFDMDINIDYTNRSITASYESFDFDEAPKTTANLSEILQKHITEATVSTSDLCERAKVDPRVMSRMDNKSDYIPSKSVILALGLALELSLEDLISLLESANYHFSKTIKRDIIIRYFTELNCYDISEINSYLKYYKELLLGSVGYN